MSKKIVLLESAGWAGALMIIAGFALNSFGVISAQSYVYLLLNLAGAVGIIAVSLYKKIYQTVAINSFWLIITLVAVMNMMIGGK